MQSCSTVARRGSAFVAPLPARVRVLPLSRARCASPRLVAPRLRSAAKRPRRASVRVPRASSAEPSDGPPGVVAAESGYADNGSVAQPRKSSSSVLLRIGTGVALGVVVIGVVLGGRLPFFLLMLAAQLAGQGEYYRMVLAKGHMPAYKMGLATTATLLTTTFLAPALADAVLPVGGTFICIYLLFRRHNFATIADISTTFMGLFYAGLLPSFWVRLHGVRALTVAGQSASTIASAGASAVAINGAATAASTKLAAIVTRLWPGSILRPPVVEVGPLLVFWSWLSCASADIGAFFVGKYFGNVRFSKISPKKTVEGAIAGFVCSAGTSMFGAYLMNWPMWQLTGALYGITVGIVGLCGDLIASSFKRDVGWKDSGHLFPGHGGILDRADSYVLIAPLVYYFATLVLPILKMR